MKQILEGMSAAKEPKKIQMLSFRINAKKGARRMSENRKHFFGFWLAVSVLFSSSNIATADTLSYVTGGVKVVEKEVIVTFQSAERIEYLKIEKEGWAEKESVIPSEHTKDLKITLASEEEKRRIIEVWKQRTSAASVTRDFGPSFAIEAFGVRYPLSEKVRYRWVVPG